MKPWQELDHAATPLGDRMTLCQRGDDYVIRVDGTELMGSRAHESEEQLAVRSLALLGDPRGARVLVGGLGMGFTLGAALRVLGADARVDVVELVPAVVGWNRGVLAHLAGFPLEDPRVQVIEDDVANVLVASRDRYDAVLMDVDNGPQALTSPGNARLYDDLGLARAAEALSPGGVFALWSASADPAIAARLRRAGLSPRAERPRARGGGATRHTLWLACAPSGKAAPRP